VSCPVQEVKALIYWILCLAQCINLQGRYCFLLSRWKTWRRAKIWRQMLSFCLQV
jgi:hypothetical protein